MKFVLCILSLVITVTVVNAANPASDQASNSPYVPGNTWVNAQNGGSGFGGWVLTSGTSSGFLIGTSSGNGGSPPSGNIDTAGVSWGMFASNGDTASAVRPFTGPNNGRQLAIGQSISLAMDNGVVQPGGMVGFSLNDGLATRAFNFIISAETALTPIRSISTGQCLILGFPSPITDSAVSSLRWALLTLGPSRSPRTE